MVAGIVFQLIVMIGFAGLGCGGSVRDILYGLTNH